MTASKEIRLRKLNKTFVVSSHRFNVLKRSSQSLRKKNGLDILTETKANLSFFNRKYSTHFYLKTFSQNVLKLCGRKDLLVAYTTRDIRLF